MKLSNLTVLFIALALPVILLLSAYTEIQIDTLSLQNEYDIKLINATYDAVSAYKINTNNNQYLAVADSTIRDIKASINTFANSLSANLGVGGYGEKYIMPYVPALVFTLYDGYYIYTPYEIIGEDGKTSYSHTLKPYVYYSKEYAGSNGNIIICYSLDNYVVIYGTIGEESFSESGYLLLGNKTVDKEKLEKNELDNKGNLAQKKEENNKDAQKYYKEAEEFTKKYNDKIERIGGNFNFLKIENSNDPEKKDSPFTLEKREVIKDSIISNLNQAMTNYTKHSDKSFRLQEFLEQDWEKIYNNICMISFLEGFPVGTKTYNNYAVIASTGNELFTNKNQIYYIVDGEEYYHKLGCPILNQEIQANVNSNVVGYKSSEFDIKKKEITTSSTDRTNYYYCMHNGKACYNCIIESNFRYENNDKATKAYYKAIARIRKNQKKASSYIH